ncbi:hypothetical protein PCASD_19947 [Puccinia coronata f. sp. avenae]|uniref:Uncharacterized protein n=1 Tax=Puccinia coronata f. sp. avenae TaxID=200324 RepID=A0A2N5SHY5_9BASI|nr:hypothetical protein PCASD_19947 [Puccinia coronata f. sp. avenae]
MFPGEGQAGRVVHSNHARGTRQGDAIECSDWSGHLSHPQRVQLAHRVTRLTLSELNHGTITALKSIPPEPRHESSTSKRSGVRTVGVHREFGASVIPI